MSGPRVLHVTLTASMRASGVATYVWKLTKALHEAGATIAVATVADEDLERDAREHLGHAELIAGPSYPTRAMGVGPGLWRRLSREIAGADVVHIHALRNTLAWWAAARARRMGKPLVISPHGQLYPEVLRIRPMRKRLISKLFENDAFFNAVDCMHATSEVEANHIREYGVRRPIAIVPIGLEPEEFDIDPEEARLALGELYPRLEGRRRVMFLSQLHPKKGLDRLAHAWAGLHKKHPDWSLVIAGPDAGYEKQARAMFDSLGIDPRSVEWTGGIYGHEKAVLLAGSDLMVLPSDWENFGIVVIEALAARTPVIATHRAPWGELESRQCGWWVPVQTEQIREAMDAGMSMAEQDRRAMGERGRQLVLERYTWDRCASQMIQMYRAITEQTALPDFVRVD